MNVSLLCFSSSRFYLASPFLNTKDMMILDRMIISNSFSTIIHSLKSIRISNSKFANNLDTFVVIKNLYIYNRTYNTYQSFVYEPENVITNCEFLSITSSHSSSGILFQSNGKIRVSFCKFISLSATYSGYGGTAFYASSGDSIIIDCCMFKLCRSPHGASYGILTSSVNLNFTYAFNSESFVGYTGAQGHSSYLEGKKYFDCTDNNASFIESTGNSGLFYLLGIPNNCDRIQRCHLSNSKTLYMIIHLTTPAYSATNLCFSNLSSSNWFNANQPLTLKKCSFIMLSSNPTWSATYMFLSCQFDKSQAQYGIPSTIISNCQFSLSYPIQHNPNIIYQCFGINQYQTKTIRSLSRFHILVSNILLQ